MTLLMFICIYYLFLLPPVGFLFLTYKIATSISVAIKHITLLIIGFIYVVTIYSLATSECLKVDATGQVKYHCVEILGKHLGASFGTFLGLIVVSQAWACFGPTEEPNLTLSIPESHLVTLDNASARNIPQSVPHAHVMTVLNVGSTIEDLPPCYWSVVRAEEAEYSGINISDVKNDLNKENINEV